MHSFSTPFSAQYYHHRQNTTRPPPPPSSRLSRLWSAYRTTGPLNKNVRRNIISPKRQSTSIMYLDGSHQPPKRRNDFGRVALLYPLDTWTWPHAACGYIFAWALRLARYNESICCLCLSLPLYIPKRIYYHDERRAIVYIWHRSRSCGSVQPSHDEINLTNKLQVHQGTSNDSRKKCSHI